MKKTLIFAITLFVFLNSFGQVGNKIYLGNGIYGDKDFMKPQRGVQNKTTSSCTSTCDLDDICSNGHITGYNLQGYSWYSYDGTTFTLYEADRTEYGNSSNGYYTTIIPNTPTANRAQRLTDEDGDIMVHNTSSPVTVNSTFQKCYISGNSFDIIDQSSGIPLVGIFPLSSIGTLYLKDSAHGYSTYFQSCPNLTADRKLRSGDWSGTIQTTVNPVPTYNGDLAHRYTSRSSMLFQAYDGANFPVANFGQISGQGYLLIYDSATGGANKLIPNLAGTYTNAGPNNDGTLLTNDGGNASTTLTATNTWTITHGLSYTPSRIMTQAKSLFVPTISYYVSAITSTTFTITLSASVTGAFNLDWQAFH